jgi:hypothetical protein
MSVDRLAGAIRREESVEVADRNTGAENFEIHEGVGALTRPVGRSDPVGVIDGVGVYRLSPPTDAPSGAERRPLGMLAAGLCA